MNDSPLNSLLGEPVPWLSEPGPDAAVAVSSRVRLARNLVEVPFPARASVAQRQEVLHRVQALAPECLSGGATVAAEMPDVDEVDRLVLVERRLISRELAKAGPGSGVIVSRDQGLCVMVNEEDHLRIQAMAAGFRLREAWERADAADTALSQSLDVAFDEQLGHLTACPTNLGTGMRASVMLHLPALALLGQMEAVGRAASELGLAVRGVYGEGTEATGDLYQVSNQSTLGESEDEILGRVERAVRQVVQHELVARVRLARRQRRRLYDAVGRAYGSLRYAYLLTSQDALALLGSLRLGVELGLVRGLDSRRILELMLVSQPGHLQRLSGRTLGTPERDALRADVIRQHLPGVQT